MKTKLPTLIIALSTAAMLAACGGGGGAGSSPVTPATAVPTNQPSTGPTPIATPTPTGAPTPIATATSTPSTGPTPIATSTPSTGPTSTATSTPTGAPTPIATATPTLAPTPTPAPVAITGKIVSIPVGSFGPTPAQSPLAGAIVIVGPTLIMGATPPPLLPAGDVQATTDANGSYSVSIAAAQIALNAANALFIKPVVDLSGITPPSIGYYISVFPTGVDGRSAGSPLPVHAFSSVTNNVLATQRVTIASSDEAGHLAMLNAARTKANAAAPILAFDETAEEAARLHATDMSSAKLGCHFDASAVGPESRYLRLLGLGGEDENVGFGGGPGGTPAQIEQQLLAFFIAEGPGGSHYDNITDSTRLWAGVSVLASADGTQYLDEELVIPHGTNPYLYGNFPGSVCPAGTPNNS